MNKQQENWMNSKWRPAMGWMYMVVCIFDFILFPILWAVIQFWEVDSANDAFRQWEPITLQGAGLFHMAMGAVLGIAAWSRGQEKMAGVTNTSFVQTTTHQAYDSGYDMSMPMRQTKYRPTKTVVGYGGRKAPPEEYQPEI
jgi:hypothetical protein